MKNFIKKLSKKKKNKKDEFKIKLTNNLVLFNQKTISKKEAIDVVGNILLKNNYISNEYIKSMHLRDKDLSVYVGNGVAIPHGTNKSQKYIKKSGVSISIYPKGIDWNNNKVYVVIGIAGKGNDHMNTIAKIGTSLSDKNNIKKIIKSNNVKNLEKIINE